MSTLFAVSGAFAAILDTGEVISWGHADLGGDSTAVHDALQQIQQIESTSGAFAAIRADGQVITWGSFFAGDEQRVAEGRRVDGPVARWRGGAVAIFSSIFQSQK